MQQDSPQNSSAVLLSEYRQVLAEFELISHGAVVSWDSNGHGKAGSRPPTGWVPVKGESEPPHVFWAERWVLEPVSGRPALLADAREALRSYKVRVAPAETDDSSLEDWVVEDGEGFAVAQVASKFGIAETRVRRIRLKADREAEFGLPLKFAQHRDNSRERVLNLAAQGCTLRQIEMQTGKPRETVRRWLKEAV